MRKVKRRFIQSVAVLSVCMAMVPAVPALGARIVGHSSSSYNSPVMETNTNTNVNSNFEFLGTDMYTYEKMEGDINLLKQRYEGVTSDSIGDSVDGRKIYRVIIGNRQAEKKILVIGAIHAREYITTPVVMRQIQEMLDKRGEGDTSLDRICIEYVPMANPDGVAISQFGVEGLRNESSKQKVRDIIASWPELGLLENQDKYNNYLRRWKNNVNGVDINHNFPTQGWPQRSDSRGRPTNEFHKGSSPGSEIETQLLVKLVNEENFNAVLNYHAQGQIIYWSNQHATPEVLAQDRALADIAVAHSGYRLVSPAVDGSRYGTGFKDWLDWEKSIPSITMEVGIGVSPVPENQIETIWQQNRGILPDIVNYILGSSSTNASTAAVEASDVNPSNE